MAAIYPFRALRPGAKFVKDVASLPYDVVSYKEARRIAADNPLSFLRVEKSEIELPPETAPHDPRIYEAARANLGRMIGEGVFFREKTPCYYIYAQEMKGHRQCGIVGCVSAAEYDGGIIKKHELTRTDKELDRIRHVDAVNGHTGPVFMTYRQRPGLDRIVEEATKESPEYSFTTEDMILHSVWRLEEPDLLSAVGGEFARVESIYIADGHHRAAAAAAVAEMRRKGPGAAPGEAEKILAVLFPHNQLKIMDYNRIVRDLNGLDKAAFLERCRERFHVSPEFAAKSPQRQHELGMYLEGSWYSLEAGTDACEDGDVVGRLDVAILQERLLKPLLGISDPRTDERIGFIGGIRGMEELERMVNSRRYAVAFSLYPPTVEQLMEVADAGRIMPPKSTWFEPKLRSGVFVHLLERG